MCVTCMVVVVVLQAFGIALTLGMGMVMDRVGILAANGIVSVTLLVGTIATS